MKKAVLTLFAIAIAFASIKAQEAPERSAPRKSPEERAENMTKRITKELTLKPEQVVKVKEVILKREKERDALMDARKKEMEKVDAEFKTILSAEQFQLFIKKKNEMIQKRKDKGLPPELGDDGPPPPPSPGDK